MDFNEFRDFGHASIELIINYLKNIRNRNVVPCFKPRAVLQQLPSEYPEQPENWKHILEDLEEIILPGLLHWQSPHFHGFFPSSSSAASIIGELLIAGIGVLGFTWTTVLFVCSICGVTTVSTYLQDKPLRCFCKTASLD